MKNAINIILLSAICLGGVSCSSPSARLRRLLDRHPELVTYTDTIKTIVVPSKSVDTLLVGKTDTFFLENVTIVKVVDTLRITQVQKPCTTFVQTTELRPTPTKAELKQARKQGREQARQEIKINKSKGRPWQMFWFGFFTAIFIILIGGHYARR